MIPMGIEGRELGPVGNSDRHMGPVGNADRHMGPQGIPRRVNSRYESGAVLYHRDPPPAAPESTASATSEHAPTTATEGTR